MIAAEEFDQLMARVCDGRASAADVQKLEALLRQDPAALDAYIRYTDLHASLAAGDWQTQSNVFAFREEVLAETRSGWNFWWGWGGWAAAAAALIVLGSVAGVWFWQGSSPMSAGCAYATLSSSVEAQWTNPNLESVLRRGELPAGSLRLASGVAEFIFASGATLLVEGPAEFEPLGPRRVFVRSGKVYCRCPTEPSRMTIVTPETEVTDLGTEFTVEVSTNNVTRVGVISGEVQLVKADSLFHLKAGESVEIRADHVLRFRPFRVESVSPVFRVNAATLEAAENTNLLKDPGFDSAVSGDFNESALVAGQWFGKLKWVARESGRGRDGSAVVRIHAEGDNLYPWVGQCTDSGDIAGKVVVASVWALQPGSDPLQKYQCAVLKVVFVDGQNRQFAYAERHFLHADDPKERFVQARLAAVAPADTVRVLFQVMLKSQSLSTGSVFFDDASLNVLSQEQVTSAHERITEVGDGVDR